MEFLAEDRINALEENLNYKFDNEKLLLEALTHSTFAYEVMEETASNERLEFLGDSVLGLVVAGELYKKHNDFNEGELTKKRSSMVNRKYLAKKAKEMELSEYLLLGKGEEKSGGRNNLTNLSGTLEAIIGAIYLDGGFIEAEKFIKAKIMPTEESLIEDANNRS